jgi:NADH dehydrogenase
MPTLNRKIRIMAGWTGNLLWRREVVPLGSLHDPRAEFRAASEPPKPRVEATPEPADHSAVPSESVPSDTASPATTA